MTLHIFPSDFEPLPIYFVTYAARHIQEPVVRPEGFLDVSQLLFVLEGEGVLHHDGIEYPLRAGSAFCIREGEAHAYHSTDGLVTAWITWRGSGCDDVFGHYGGKRFAYFEGVDCKKYVRQIEQLDREYFGKRREGILSVMLYSMLISFFEEQKYVVMSDMDRVLCYMEEHFDEKITVDELAQIHRSSKSTFCEKFKRTFGCTAFEKLIEIRLVNAESILKMNPTEKILSVAKKCGFGDVSYFCKLYKKKFGKSPGMERM